MTASGASDFRQRLRRWRRPAWLGTARRTTPLSAQWGRDRGRPVDRLFIEGFLARHRERIHGDVLELLDDRYTVRFGAGVTRSDVLDIDAGNPRVTVVADLQAADAVADCAYDCFILTQTLQYVFDVPAALRHAHRILRPGGTLLCTVPTVSRLERPERDDEFWRFTPAACRRLVEDAFPGGEVEVETYGNVLVAVAFLLGMAAEELKDAELDVRDPRFPVLVAARATRAAAG